MYKKVDQNGLVGWGLANFVIIATVGLFRLNGSFNGVSIFSAEDVFLFIGVCAVISFVLTQGIIMIRNVTPNKAFFFGTALSLGIPIFSLLFIWIVIFGGYTG